MWAHDSTWCITNESQVRSYVNRCSMVFLGPGDHFHLHHQRNQRLSWGPGSSPSSTFSRREKLRGKTSNTLILWLIGKFCWFQGCQLVELGRWHYPLSHHIQYHTICTLSAASVKAKSITSDGTSQATKCFKSASWVNRLTPRIVHYSSSIGTETTEIVLPEMTELQYSKRVLNRNRSVLKSLPPCYWSTTPLPFPVGARPWCDMKHIRVIKFWRILNWQKYTQLGSILLTVTVDDDG